jgi:hypothetical protein
LADLSTLIDLVHPTVSGQGIITTDQAFILFDREMDETTVAGGNFFLTGPDFDTWSGPDLQLFHDFESIGSEEEILQSPGLRGIVQGAYTFQRIDLSDEETVVSSVDTVGSGFLFRTKAIFTPTQRLASSTTYQVYVSGDEDESDTLKTGISTRTVFDTVTSGTNTGTGLATFTGGYKGTVATDMYHVTVTTAGEVGTAKFEWYRDQDPLSVFGPLRTKRSGVLLSDGVTVAFDEGDYEVDDHWHVVVKEREVFVGNLTWPFTTGTGSIGTLPDTTSTSVIGDPVTTSTTTTSTSSFTALSTSPADEATHQTLPNGPFPVTVSFSADIDQDTLVSGTTVTAQIDPVNGDETITASGAWTDFDLSVDGQNLEIAIPSGVLKINNLVSMTIDSTLSSTGGTSLSGDYEFWFTTRYSPLYCSARKLRLQIGSFITNIIDDTLNLASFEASLMVDAMTLSTLVTNTTANNYFQMARGQWVCCKASEILLMNTTGGSNSLRAKRLGDLQVEYNPNATNDALDRALACQARWEPVIRAAGLATQTSRMTIKGILDPDRPTIGRQWRLEERSQLPAANTKTIRTGRRRASSIFDRRNKGLWGGGKRGRDW